MDILGVNREIELILLKKMFQNRIIILYGPRRVGKTTLVKKIQEKFPNSIYYSCDEPDVRANLENKTSTELFAFLKGKKVVIFDEAQLVNNIGMSLKLIIDNFPQIQIIATGSSSFDLANKLAEPLTGRKFEFFMNPFSQKELKQIYSNLELKRSLENFLLFGSYPEIVMTVSDKILKLKELARSYAFKDILQFGKIKNPQILEKLLQALALQIGGQVSYQELAQLLGVDKKTITSYIEILEKAFIIFRLGTFSRNLRNELKKTRKIYFWDTGLRNAFLNNFSTFDLRNDIGALFENFLIVERLKNHYNQSFLPNLYFWRNQQKQEIDLVEEIDGKIKAFEIKYKKNKYRKPKKFLKAYPNSTLDLINQENYLDFLGV